MKIGGWERDKDRAGDMSCVQQWVIPSSTQRFEL